MTRVILGLLLLLTVATVTMLPPKAATATPGRASANAAERRPPVRGAIHVHSNRSDGTGSPDEIAAAAARAGLSFVVLTDHGDGTRSPEPPTYRSGVLVIDALEANSDDGHVVAVGLPQLPYPLGGVGRDVLDDIRRFGGVSIVAHPESPDPQRRWSGGDDGFDGIEWLNADSEWRDESVASLAPALLTYWLRPAETLAALLDRPGSALARWDRAAATRPVVGVAASDVHARIGLRGTGEPYDGRPVLRVPGYEWVFRAFSIQLTDVRLTREAPADAVAVLNAIRRGAVVSAVDGVAGQGYLEVSAESGTQRAGPGAELPLSSEPLMFRITNAYVTGARGRLVRDGQVVSEWDAGQATSIEQPAQPGAYRVEIVLPGPGRPTVPWLLANPIYVGRPVGASPSAVGSPPEPLRRVPIFVDGDGHEWAVEKSARADGRVAAVKTVDGTQLSIRFAVGGRLSDQPFVAAARPVDPPSSEFDALYLTVRAARPMRVSVQFRAGIEPGAKRWGHSIYIDETARRIRLPFASFLPKGHEAPFDVRQVTDLLLVVDTVNTALGASGQFWIDDLLYGGGAPNQVRTDSSK